MSDKSDYFRDAILEYIRGTAMPAAPAGLYVALYNGDPQGAGVDVTATINPAGRQALTFGAPANGIMSNDATVDFGASAGNATVSHFAIFDSQAAGNMLASDAVTTQRAVTTGANVFFAAGELTWVEL